ncbi:hypothetical protein VDGE_09787 [Verticillium dahliae]|uniref:Uncharacterized protein n=1 Tax=Verticillium dahliae TaxID=27337 RepID=A0A444RQ09_VERDA|nr:hypothetical protein VDGE_09787 [Verticillium dahliae]
MCQTVYYSYSCGHLECVVYRCRRMPAHPSRWELYDCVTRAAADGSWRTSLREPCHDCVEAERLRRWTLQRGGRAAPWNLAGRSMSNGTRISQSASAPNVGEVQNQQWRQQQQNQQWQQQQQQQQQQNQQWQQQQQQPVASQQRLVRHVQGSRDGSASSSSSMGWDGRVIRPLDSNYLGNIGRITLDGVHWEDVTPAEIFEARF